MTSRFSRRRFLQLAGLASAAAATRPAIGLPGLFDPLKVQKYDDGNRKIPGGLTGEAERVIVIGAGFAGLAVANALSNAGVKCVVLEGRDRIGGRAHTVDVGGSPVDLGCSWITDPVGNPMTRFATASGVLQTNATIELDVPTSRFYDERTGVVGPIGLSKAVAEALRFSEVEAPGIADELGRDASTKDGILRYVADHGLKGNARRRAEYFMRLLTEVPDATDWDKDSLYYWANYEGAYFGFGQGDFPVGGYIRLVDSMSAGADVRLRHRVTRVAYDDGGVRVEGIDARGRAFDMRGSHVLVTVPLGVLKAGAIQFSPALPPSKLGAIGRLGFGTFEKVVMRFPEPYWANEHTHIFHLSHPAPMRFPLIIDYFHLEAIPVLVAFNVGSQARSLGALDDREIASRMVDVLRTVEGGPIPAPTDVVATRWHQDPFTSGAYSFIPVGASPADQWELGRPVGGRVLFAGEASNQVRFGYADGAMSTGIREAKRLLRQPYVELRAT